MERKIGPLHLQLKNVLNVSIQRLCYRLRRSFEPMSDNRIISFCLSLYMSDYRRTSSDLAKPDERTREIFLCIREVPGSGVALLLFY